MFPASLWWRNKRATQITHSQLGSLMTTTSSLASTQPGNVFTERKWRCSKERKEEKVLHGKLEGNETCSWFRMLLLFNASGEPFHTCHLWQSLKSHLIIINTFTTFRKVLRCRMIGQRLSVPDRVICSVGVPQGTVLAPFLFMLYRLQV